jgi:clathrin heavy chain
MQKTGYAAITTPFLKSVQTQNIKEVNEALNDIHL